MKTYEISQAYNFVNGSVEIQIISDDLLYCELVNHSGVQCLNIENSELIRKKCQQIADLIREIEILNVKQDEKTD